MERKYITEFGLDVYTSFKTLIPVENLKQLERMNDIHNYHIYSILSYPQIYYKMNKTYIAKRGIKITLFEICNSKEIEYELPIYNISNDIDYSKVELNSIYPNNNLCISIKDRSFLKKHSEFKNPSISINAQDLFNFFVPNLKDTIEYEVLYIGQAYGSRGERTAITRLSAHSTLQKILTDCQKKYSNKHIYLLLLEMTPLLNINFDGLAKRHSTTDEEDSIHIKKVFSDLPREQQIINITEAAMINYFKPIYNTNFVENFPYIKHKGYKQYFDLDYNCLVIELDLEFDNYPLIKLYTETNRINNSYDDIKYNLFDDPKRKNMYDIFQKH